MSSITIRDAFAKSSNGKAFVAFVTAGDPSIAVTEELVCAMAEEGVDLIELGIPFSDPTAEGPVIQAASLRALTSGVRTNHIFEMVRRLRADISVPMVFMTYANVVFSYGKERFCERCREVGIQGMILPDVPYEEKDEFDPVCKENGLDLISLIAPTSEDRIGRIARDASGFVYCVSSLGVTGVRSEITTDIGAMVRLVKQAKDIPCAIGFGISTPDQARQMAQHADGVIVGSAIMKLIAKHGRDAEPLVAEYVREMKEAVREL